MSAITQAPLAAKHVRTVVLVLAWVVGLPTTAVAMTYDEARHLLGRAGFGGTAAEIEALAHLAYGVGVNRLLDVTTSKPQSRAPTWVNEPPPDFRKLRSMTDDERTLFRKQRRKQTMELKAWWYGEMMQTDSPLTERMTLFWHNHFTSGLRKVKWPTLMYRQNLLLRRHALGNFRELLNAVSKDPAMILYLDNQTNRKGKPNENFARELLELFTLGEGHYVERDIKEAARAFTGWMVDHRTGRFRFNLRRHDVGIKTFMGRTGTFSGDEILGIVLDQSRVAVHISEKLWRAFISDTPNRREVERLAAVFRESNYEIKPLVRELLMSPHFRATELRGTLVKSPVDMLVGTIRVFHIPMRDGQVLVRLGRYLGQDLFDPPNVKGWPGGNAWITTSTLLARQQFLERLVRGKEMPAPDTFIDRRMRRTAMPVLLEQTSGLTYDNVQRTLLPIPPVNPVPKDADLRTLIGHLVLDPAYQLK
ncbi:MAG: DUF1800 family protein [Acidiferrobacterales bacterium]